MSDIKSTTQLQGILAASMALTSSAVEPTTSPRRLNVWKSNSRPTVSKNKKKNDQKIKT